MALISIAVFWIAYDDGSYEIGGRSSLAIAICWALILGLGLSVWPLSPIPRAARLAGLLLGSFALWTLASLAWTPDRELSFAEFNRVALFVLVFALVVVATNRSLLGPCLDGLTAGIMAIAVVALVSRLFPSSFSDRGFAGLLPGSQTRLSFPLGYWNGLAIFVALGLPLLLRGAASWRHPALRGAAVAGMPPIACVVYLASSRGGLATALAGATVTVLAARRWSIVVAVTIGGFAAAVVVRVLASQHELVDGPLRSAAAASQGHRVALLLVLVCATTAALFALGARWIAWAPPAAAGWALAFFVWFALVTGTVAASPQARFEDFKEPPSALAVSDEGFVRAHLLSGNGSGRWQFWTAAADQWRDRPLAGHGAGSYQSWWLANGSFSYFVRDAHSLYLQTLGELGIVGFALLLGALGVVVAAGIGRLRAAEDADDRAAVAALLGLTIAWLVAAGIDWMWQLTATTVLAMTAFALLTGPATGGRVPAGVAPTRRRQRIHGWARISALVAACVLIACSAVPWLADMKIGASQAAVRRGDSAAALTAALAARNLEPWASTPYLQLALVSEQAGALRAAGTWIDRAIARSPEDWRLWLVAARIDTKRGRVARAQHELDRAIELNPRSPLFQNLPH